MEELIGKALVAEKDTVIQIIIRGNSVGILTDLDYKVRSNNKNEIEDFLRTVKIGVVGVAATEAIEELTAENILENFELLNDDVYIAKLIEKGIQKAIFEYLQLQLNLPIEPVYDE